MGITCFCNNIGFIKSKSELKEVDLDIRGVVQNINKIPYAGTYEVSCSGHFIEQGDGKADAIPYGSLSLVLCIRKPHITELVKELFDFKEEYKGTSICLVVDKYLNHDFAKELHNVSDINEKCIIGRTKEGYNITNLIIKQNDLGSMGPNFNPSIMERIDKAFFYYEKAKQRYKEIKENWDVLKSRLDDYCSRYRFNNVDFEKKEFAPFGQLA